MWKMLAGALIIVASLFLLSAPNALAQLGPCTADFNCDYDVDADDVAEFLSQFGREPSFRPCPGCYDSPCPCSSNVPKTGQATSFATGDDGDLEKGLAWPNPRFTDNLDGTVTDNLTNLIWLKDANCFGTRVWNSALSDSNGLADGSCGLTDGSNAGDWRLPNYRALFSLIDAENYSPALPSGHPFTNVQSNYYWSSTTWSFSTTNAWRVRIDHGFVSTGDTAAPYYVWPVRGGH